ncbi:MAG TPA: hypothetical protein VIL49_11170 [Capillimicrobium sp.]|jgi:predicted RNA-binding Zn-ribbon protein involved in translation (DUF1610 family)
MLACTDCGRAWNSRALDPVWLTSATCPACGADLLITSHERRTIAAQPREGRFARAIPPATRLDERLTGLGG